MKAFRWRGKDEVLSLLPHAHQPHLIRDKNWRGYTLLHYAVDYGWTDVLKYLLTLKSVSDSVSHRDVGSDTPMELVNTNKYAIYSMFASHVNFEMELRVRAMFNIFISGNE